MFEIYTSVAIGTAAALLAVILVLLRVDFKGRRPFLALTRRWVAASPLALGIVLAPLAVIAMICFVRVPVDEARDLNAAIRPSVDAAAPEELQSLRAYADGIGAKQQPADAAAAASAVELPAVDTMIAKLAARLQQQPNDVKGWKMLGWSYLNMNMPADAAKAYNTAMTLDPGDVEIKNGLEAANAALSAASQAAPSETPPSSTAAGSSSAEGLPDGGQSSMIRGMVDQLAARLETSPKDEDGWLRLMRSRMTLGEGGAAKAALAKALAAFANDEAAAGRLTAAARELGVEND